YFLRSSLYLSIESARRHFRNSSARARCAASCSGVIGGRAPLPRPPGAAPGAPWPPPGGPPGRPAPPKPPPPLPGAPPDAPNRFRLQLDRVDAKLNHVFKQVIGAAGHPAKTIGRDDADLHAAKFRIGFGLRRGQQSGRRERGEREFSKITSGVNHLVPFGLS